MLRYMLRYVLRMRAHAPWLMHVALLRGENVSVRG